MEDKNLYTPQELVNEFPVLAEIEWNATKLGLLFKMGMLKGRRVNRQSLITLGSLKELIDFYNSINDDDINL